MEKLIEYPLGGVSSVWTRPLVLEPVAATGLFSAEVLENLFTRLREHLLQFSR